MSATRDEFYLFTMPGDMCPVWFELFLPDGTHTVAPSPFMNPADAMNATMQANPAATVDELYLAEDIEQARMWARTMPLEQITA
jgi:hypothetical protein